MPLGRPCITALIDVFIKNIIGIFVSFYKPGYLSVMKCLLHAIKPKSYLKEIYPEIQNVWLCYSLPELLVVNNAAEFYSQDFTDACAQLGISIQYAPTKKVWYKTSIERFFRTENQSLIHTLPGTTFSNIFDKKEYDPEKDAVISFDSLLKLLHVWIVDDYHQKPHRGIKDIPARRWRESIGKWEPNLPPNDKSLRVLLGFIEYRTVTAGGIELFGLQYNCHELSAVRRFSSRGTKEIIKYDPDDISHIYCYNRRDDEYISVPALDQEYTSGLTLRQHNAIKRYNQKVLKCETDNAGLLKAKETIKQIVAESISALKTIGKRQKLMRFLNVGQPDFTTQSDWQDKSGFAEIGTKNHNQFSDQHSFAGLSKIGINTANGEENTEEANSTLSDFKIIPLNSKRPVKPKNSTKKLRNEGNQKNRAADPVDDSESSEKSFVHFPDNLKNYQENAENSDDWSVSYDLPIN